MHPPPLADLRAELDGVLDDRGGAHVERLTYCAAVLCTALESAGMRPALVGGAAIEFYLPDAYATSDLDFVVERATPDALDRVFTALGFRRTGRHWTRSDLFVEVPGLWIDEATREVPIGRHRLRVVTVEPLIGERIVGFRYWKVWAHGVQAVALLRGLAGEYDEAALRAWVRREQAENVLDLLLEVAEGEETVTATDMDRLWNRHFGREG